jgi:serine/threonine-protein kinase
MGEVYRAMDTKLNREVAIKVLPTALAGDAERLARFQREAELLASLNHSNIAAIYGLEESGESKALVLELVEGDTLADRLRKGPMAVEDALETCLGIAEALEAAHEKGIIHRDLKPANVKFTSNGKVKVLDFGLAKAMESEPNSMTTTATASMMESPTITADYTKPGTILGTAAYMSPEQARGKGLDKRTDIWSFGCVLFECLTGKKLFQGEDVTETLASIIKGEPEWTSLPSDTPAAIRILLRKCLAKDRKRRLPDIAAASIDLAEAIEDPSSSMIRLSEGALEERTRKSGLPRLVTAIIVLVVALVGLAVGWFFKPIPLPPLAPAMHAELILPDKGPSFLAISPDGRFLGFDTKLESSFHLRRLDVAGFKEIGTNENIWNFCFSPDGESVAYATINREVWKVGLDGSKPVLVSEGYGNGKWIAGLSWSESGVIVIPGGWLASLRRVPFDGGQAEPLTTLKEGEVRHAWPQCLPGGAHVLFTILTQGGSSEDSEIKAAFADLATGEHQILPLEGDCKYVRYAESGHLLYVNDGILFAVPFDLDSMSITGSKKDVVQGVAIGDGEMAYYDISTNGTLVYKAGPVFQGKELSYQLKWLHRDGTEQSLTTLHGTNKGSTFTLSPDNKHVAWTSEGDDGNKDIWTVDLERPFPERFTTDEANDDSPFWSADGQWIYFKSDRLDGRPGLWRKRADSPDSSAEFVWDNEGKEFYPSSLSREGNHLTYTVEDPTWDIWTIPLDQETPTKRLLKGSPATERWDEVSPDGKWLAYTSNRTGSMEIYVAPFDNPDFQPWPVTRDWTGSYGGKVMWSSTGDRLFYKSFVQPSSLFSVDVIVENDAISTGPQQKFLESAPKFRHWQMDAKGERVLALGLEDASESDGTDSDHNVVHVVSNFFTLLNEKAPPAGKK